MGIVERVRNWWDARRRKRTRRDVHDALDRAYEAADTRDVAAADRIIVFSDLHKGARDGADDFLRCERTYNAALAYYNKLEYHLIELGDVEELWENSFPEVAECYEHTLRLAAAFRGAGRYTRFWGNHDLAWKDASLFHECMDGYGYRDVTPLEALRLVVHDAGGTRQGELFLVHGHQGTADSDRNAAFSRLFVRRAWRPLQRMLNRPWNTPSVDWALRGRHAADMEAWATTPGRVLIAGHTHLPVFFKSRKEPETTPAQVKPPPAGDDAEALRLAWLEWAQAEAERLKYQRPAPLDRPCYFNTGCCAFGDGDITGIEIRDGKISLVRWPCEPHTEREELETMELAEVFRLTSGPPGRAAGTA